jgi:hypothetical protein
MMMKHPASGHSFDTSHLALGTWPLKRHLLGIFLKTFISFEAFCCADSEITGDVSGPCPLG